MKQHQNSVEVSNSEERSADGLPLLAEGRDGGRHWTRWYILVICFLALLIFLFYQFTKAFS